MTEQLLQLPKKPGTVIAIGEWWLIRLRSYEGAPSAWEMLPLPSRELGEHAERNGVKTQCIYDDEWVLAEVEQEGGYVVISDPREHPSGVQYFRPSAKLAAAEPIWDELATLTPPIGARVRLTRGDARGEMVGTVRSHDTEPGYVKVRWDRVDHDAIVRQSNLEPEEQQ